MDDNERMIASVKKAFDLLDVLAFEDLNHRGVRLIQLAERTGQKPNTLRGILKTMIACGYVEQDEHGRYRAGLRCDQIGIVNRFRMSPQTTRVLNERLKMLCDETGESVSFYVLTNGERINYTNYLTRDIIKVDYSMLMENNLYEYPSGRVMVSFCDENELDLIIRKHGYPKKSWANIVNRAQLDAEIAKVRAQVVLFRESEEGVASFACPVFDQERHMVGSAGVYMPLFRLTPEKGQMIRRKLREFAEKPL